MLILVVGQTEETFCKQMLAEYLQTSGIYPQPVLLSGTGGVSIYSKVHNHVLKLLSDSSAIAVTTMLDYYGIPHDFPGKQQIIGKNGREGVRYLEDAFRSDIGNPRFLPYLMLHEFEAMLFADITQLFSVIPKVPDTAKKALKRVCSDYPSPEDIDDGPSTHPSARITASVPGYQKTLHGLLALQRVGIDVIRKRYPHFDEWLSNLLQL